jgi:3-hydroxyisobutyrate dehydrogenase-like beta-hydroxyacid dehydrogenase
MTTLGWIGLGAMGSRMAKRLLDAGHPVVGYNRTPARARPLADAGMRVLGSPREVAEAAEVVFSMVTDDRALDQVAHGSTGVLAGLRRGAVWAEMSTVSPAIARSLAEEVAPTGAQLLDAPVAGSPLTIEQGQLSIMVGGDAAALERVRPYLLAIGPTVTHVGPVGLAKTMKVAVNLSIAVQVAAFAESIALAEKAGIPRGQAVDALLKSVAGSPMLKYRGPFVTGMPAEAWFDVPMIQKDLDLALDLGHRAGVPLPLAAQTHAWLTAARALGLGDYDFAVVFDVLARLSGLPPSPKAG